MSVYDVNGNVLTSVYALDGSALASAFSLSGEQIFPDGPTPPEPIVWLDTAIATQLPSYPVRGVKQGACTDGTYIYIICFDSGEYTSGKFVKYKISDGSYTTTTFDGSINFGHGNDMCYNPNNNHIYVLCMTQDGKIIELDTSFNVLATHYFTDEQGEPFYSYRVAFDRKTNCFITGTAYKFIVSDQNFNWVSSIDLTEPPQATGQGCETDGDYIYRLMYNPGYIIVNDMTGALVKTINHTIPVEAEAIMYDWATGKMYVSRYTDATGYIYEVQLKE